MTTIKPTQRDRGAAIQRARELGAQMAVLEEMRELIRAGRCDDGTAVQTALKALNAERAIGYMMGIEAAAKALEDDAQLCDCHARSEGECACGAWSDYKTVPMERAVDIVRALSDNAEAIPKGNQQ